MLREMKAHEKLQQLLVQYKVERKEMARATNISYFTLSKYISGERRITDAAAELIRNYLSPIIGKQLPVDYFIDKLSETKFMDATAIIPLYKYEDNGTADLTKNDIIDYVHVAKDAYKEGDYFALRYTAQAFRLPFAKTIDVIFHKQNVAANGQLAAVLYKGKLLMRIVHFVKDSVVLYWTHTDTDVITDDYAKNITVVGVAEKIVIPL